MAASAKVEDKSAVVPAPAAQTQITITTQPAVEARPPVAANVVTSGVVKTGMAKNDAVKSGAVTNVAVNTDAVKKDAANAAGAAMPAQNPSSVFTLAPGSAAAPAPAKEATIPPAKENKTVELELAKPTRDTAPESTPTLSSPVFTNAPSFAALNDKDSGGSGGSKKVLIAAGVVLALAALGYLGYGKLGKSSTTPAVSALHTGQPATALAPTSSPVAASASATGNASSTNQTVASKAAAAPDKLAAGAENAPAVAKKSNAAPIVVKSSVTGSKTQTQSDESAPPLSVTSANDSNLTGLMSSAPSSVPKLSVATLKVSQGVSQGLLIKRVQPQYPQAALAMHSQGAVQIEATIGKEGNVTNVKVLSGEAILARAAVEAVRQWRYKPYYLDGTPVEIQTQITINFKAN
jgi:TonB family protein